MLIALIASSPPTSKHHQRKSSIGAERQTIMVNNMKSSRKYLILCTILFHIAIQVRHSQQQATNGVQQLRLPDGATNNTANQADKSTQGAISNSAANSGAKNRPTSDEEEPVDEILKDTFMLLDVLDRKLASVSNKTPSALINDNLKTPNHYQRKLETQDDENEDLESIVRKHPEFAILSDTDVSFQEKLDKLAASFSPGRKSGDSSELRQPQSVGLIESMLVAASNERSTPVEVIGTTNLSSEKPANPIHSLGASQSPAPIMIPTSSADSNSKKSSRQLPDDSQLTSDSTERHIKFTLDLMQSIFSSQSYSSKTNSIESFLISPLSIQMVLMMMHLGARGQTRREIGNCLHLNAIPANHQLLSTSKSTPDRAATLSNAHPLEPAAGSDLSGLAMANKLKRRIQLSAGAAPDTSNPKQSNPAGTSAKSTTTRPQLMNPVAFQQQQQPASGNNAHELFGSAMRNLLKDPIVTKALTSANQIFLQKNLPLSNQYDWAIKHYYAADVKQVDFQHQTSGILSPAVDRNPKSQDQSTLANASLANSTTANENHNNAGNNIQLMINDWVERQTRGRISNFLTGPISTSTLMMAINVLYFKGDWQYKFDPSDTQPESLFTQANGKTIKLPMMCARLPVAFAHDPIMKTSVIELPYKAQRLGLFLLLPDEISGIFHTMQMLNSTSFANLISSMRKSAPTNEQGPNGIDVRIPRFSIESSPRLSQILSQQLGLKTLFSPDVADLSGMFAPPPVNFKQRPTLANSSNQIQVTQDQQTNNHQGAPLQVGLDELIHKAVLQVDEQGSVAAASSATIVERVGLFTGNYFEADHPFLLFLMDKQTGLVLFSGAFAGGNNGYSSSNTSSQEAQRQRQQQLPPK